MTTPAPMKITVDGEEVVIRGAPAIAAARAVLTLVNPKKDRSSVTRGGGPLALFEPAMIPVYEKIITALWGVIEVGVEVGGPGQAVGMALEHGVGAALAIPIPQVKAGIVITAAVVGLITYTMDRNTAVYMANEFKSRGHENEASELQKRLVKEFKDDKKAFVEHLKQAKALKNLEKATAPYARPTPKRGGSVGKSESVGEGIKKFLLDLSTLETDDGVNTYLYGIVIKNTPEPEVKQSRKSTGFMGGRRTRRNKRY